MACILDAEPDPDLLALIERTLVSWGHEPVRYRAGAPPAGVDVMILEPAFGAQASEVAARLASATPSVPLVGISVALPEPVGAEKRRPSPEAVALRELQAAVEKAVGRLRRRA